ncbi:MAG: hypothetical protein JNL01_07250 [Bdellovibrionales bacterium]|nr:hypothetical protein [Bdellovibrionales bacterium]
MIFLFRNYSEKPDTDLRPVTERGRELFKKYDLEKLKGRISAKTFRDGISYLDLLDQIPKEALVRAGSKGPWVDVGSRDFAYAWSLSIYLESKSMVWDGLEGIEVTGTKFFKDLSTPKKRADFHLSDLSRVYPQKRFRYHAKDVRSQPMTASGIFWFFPFVTLSAHKKWGLSARDFNPSETLKSVQAPVWIVANFTQTEAELFRNEMAKAHPSYSRVFSQVIEGGLHPSPHPIVISVWSAESKPNA